MRRTVSIRTALISITLLAAVIMMGLMGLTYYSQIARDKADRASAELEKLHVALTDIEFALLQARGAERDYLIFKSDEAAKQFSDRMWQINGSTAHAYQLMGAAPEHAANLDLLGKLANSAAAYKGAFDKFADLQRSLGSSPDDGLQGELRAAVHGVEKALEAITLHPEMQAKMLMMWRHEKDFMLREDPEYLAKLNDRVAEFRAFPLTNYQSFAQKKEIDALLTQYQTAFATYVEQALVAKDMRLKLTEEFGVAAPLLEEIKANFVKTELTLQLQTNAAEAQARELAIALSVAGIVLFAAVTLWVSMLIARPLMAIGTALDHMRTGDFSSPLRPSRIRETAVIAGAFEDFRKDMSLRQSIETEVSAVISACAEGDFSRRITLADGQADTSGLVGGVNAIGEAAKKRHRRCAVGDRGAVAGRFDPAHGQRS